MISEKIEGSRLEGSKMGSKQQQLLLEGEGEFKNKHLPYWTPCYFVLHPHYFLIFKHRRFNQQRPTRAIHLKDIIRVVAEQRNQFIINTDKDKHQLRVDNHEQLVQWMGAINKVIVRYRHLKNMQ